MIRITTSTMTNSAPAAMMTITGIEELLAAGAGAGAAWTCIVAVIPSTFTVYVPAAFSVNVKSIN
jgi:hypothetical protein